MLNGTPRRVYYTDLIGPCRAIVTVQLDTHPDNSAVVTLEVPRGTTLSKLSTALSASASEALLALVERVNDK